MSGLTYMATITVDHLRNITGASLTTVKSGIAATPLDPVIGYQYTVAYPIEKLYALRQTYTTYSGFLAGDYLRYQGTDYAVKWSKFWKGNYTSTLENFNEVIVEEPH